MYSELFSIGPFTVHSYGLMIAIGTIFAFCTAMFRAKRKGLDSEFVFDVGFYAMIAGLIGTRLLYYIVELPQIIKDPSILWDFGNGYVVYGGIIGGLLMGVIYCKIKKKNFFDYFDLIMPSIVLAQGFGRIGCFLAGCCYGKETDSAFGVVFHDSLLAPNGVKLIPTQLISSAGDFLIYVLLVLFAKRSKKRGQVGAMYLILYSIGRFFVEFLRDDYRGSVGIFSTSQLISLGIVVIGLVMFLTAKPRPETQDQSSDKLNLFEKVMNQETALKEEIAAEQEIESEEETTSKQEIESEEVTTTDRDEEYEVVILKHEDEKEK